MMSCGKQRLPRDPRRDRGRVYSVDQVMIFHPSLNYVHLFWSPCWKGGLLLLLLPLLNDHFQLRSNQ
ncbi:hypothetical protein CsatA_003222 [Cannabis sativa]